MLLWKLKCSVECCGTEVVRQTADSDHGLLLRSLCLQRNVRFAGCHEAEDMMVTDVGVLITWSIVTGFLCLTVISDHNQD